MLLSIVEDKEYFTRFGRKSKFLNSIALKSKLKGELYVCKKKTLKYSFLIFRSGNDFLPISQNHVGRFEVLFHRSLHVCVL